MYVCMYVSIRNLTHTFKKKRKRRKEKISAEWGRVGRGKEEDEKGQKHKFVIPRQSSHA